MMNRETDFITILKYALITALFIALCVFTLYVGFSIPNR
jgi:hypothetical protein